MEYYQKLDLRNQFQNEFTGDSVNFRNDTAARDNVSSIEITKRTPGWVAPNGTPLVEFKVDVEDNVAMALALLGVGRVTDDVEERASVRANFARENYQGLTFDDLMDIAVVNLRAILIAKQREAEEASKDMKDAYSLYLLAYPKSNIVFDEFATTQINKHWLTVLRKVRQDPTVLGAL